VIPEWVLRGERFVREDIEPRTGDFATIEGRTQRISVDDRSTRDVDQRRRLPHSGERARVEQVPGPVDQRRVDGHEPRTRQQLLERDEFRWIVREVRRREERVACEHVRAKGGGPLTDRPTDRAVADDAG
jgi:hypothetical protein